jgi:hypothetical protein
VQTNPPANQTLAAWLLTQIERLSEQNEGSPWRGLGNMELKSPIHKGKLVALSPYRRISWDLCSPLLNRVNISKGWAWRAGSVSIKQTHRIRYPFNSFRLPFLPVGAPSPKLVL